MAAQEADQDGNPAAKGGPPGGNEQRFRMLLDNLPGAIYRCEVQPPWRMDVMSEGIATITGFPAQEYLTGRFRRFSEAICPEDLPRVVEMVERQIDADRPYELEYRLREAGGGWRWVFERGHAVTDEDGRPRFLEGIFLDITARKDAEEKLQSVEALGRDILDSLTANVAVIDEQGEILTVNRAWREFAAANGAPAGLREGTGVDYLRPCLQAALTEPEPDAAVVLEGIHRVLRGERSIFRHEYPCHSPDTRRWFEISVVPLTGRRLGAVIAHENITPRKLLEQALFDSENRFRAVTEIVSDFAYAFRFRPDGQMVREWRIVGRHDYFGIDSEAGGNIQEVMSLVHPEDLPLFTSRLAVLRAGHPQVTEYRLVLPDGSIRWLRDYGRPMVDEEGQVCGIIGALQDITAQRTAELERAHLAEQLQQAQKLESLGRLAGGVAHDFNNLLTVMNGYTQLLLMRLPEGDANREALQQVQTAGERAAELVEQLLTFSRRKRLAPQVLELGEAVRGMRPMIARLVGEDIEVLIELDAGACRVMADPGQIQQILLNLAANARDAMPQGGRLAIGVCPAGDGRLVRLSFADTGVGMDRETQARIFEPFFTTKETGKGTGLGLATVHGIVTQAGGHIEVRSEPGEGTVFRIFLPAAEAGEAVTETEAGATPAPAPGSETILLVEDQPDVRAFTAQVLRSFGYRVQESAAAADALRILERQATPIDLLLTDVVMPGLGGAELARLARLKRPQLRVVFMSGYWGDAQPLQHDPARGDWFLRKPFQVDELGHIVRHALAALPRC